MCIQTQKLFLGKYREEWFLENNRSTKTIRFTSKYAYELQIVLVMSTVHSFHNT